MKNRNVLTKLEDMGACDEAREWVAKHGGDMATLWNECPRADWMAWFISRDKRLSFTNELILANVDMVEYLLKRVKTPNHELYKDALKAVQAWAKGAGSATTISEVRRAINRARYEEYITGAMLEFLELPLAPRSSWGVSAYAAEAISFHAGGSEESALKHLAKYFRKYFVVGQRGLTTVKGVNNG